MRASAGAPISVAGRLWGVMIVSSGRERGLAAGTEQRLAEFTDLVATAIANAQAREELSALATEQAALRRVATLVARGEPPAVVFAAVAEEVGRLISADLTLIGRYDPDGTVTGVGGWDSNGKTVPAGTRVAVGGRNVTARVLQTRRTARKMGVESTGHGAAGAEAFGAMPSNIVLEPGSRSPEQLIAGIERGLLVTDFWYTRILDPKTQVVTGLTRNGLFLVEDGHVSRGVHNLRFTQSYAGALAPGNVKALAPDARLVNSSAFVPSLHLASWNFTGGARG
jgi:GAF domain-containing protein